jgi:hypothetical protein
MKHQGQEKRLIKVFVPSVQDGPFFFCKIFVLDHIQLFLLVYQKTGHLFFRL